MRESASPRASARCVGDEMSFSARRPDSERSWSRIATACRPSAREAVLLQHGDEHRLELRHRTRGDRRADGRATRHVGRVIDEVVGPVASTAVVEELDAHVPVEGQDPVADLVDLMQERAFVASRARPTTGRMPMPALARRDRRRRARQHRGKRREQVGQLLSSHEGQRDAVARYASPGDGRSSSWYSTWKSCTSPCTGAADSWIEARRRAHLLGRETGRRATRGAPRALGVRAEVRRAAHREARAWGEGGLRSGWRRHRPHAPVRRRTARAARRAPRRHLARRDRARRGGCRSGYPRTRLAAAAPGASPPRTPARPGLNALIDQRADVGMLDEVPLHPRGEVRAVDDSTTDAGLGQSEGGADLTDQTARVGLVGGRVERPVWREVVDGCHQTTADRLSAWRRQHRGMPDWRKLAQQGVAGRQPRTRRDPCARPRATASPVSAHVANQRTRSGCVGATRAASRRRPRWSMTATVTVSRVSMRHRSPSAALPSGLSPASARWRSVRNQALVGVGIGRGQRSEAAGSPRIASRARMRPPRTASNQPWRASRNSRHSSMEGQRCLFDRWACPAAPSAPRRARRPAPSVLRGSPARFPSAHARRGCEPSHPARTGPQAFRSRTTVLCAARPSSRSVARWSLGSRPSTTALNCRRRRACSRLSSFCTAR